MPEYQPSEKQLDGFNLLCGPATHILLRGGARSGKTVQIVRFMILRAISAAGSTHAIFRHTFSSIRTSLINGTVPLVLGMCFPDIANDVTMNQTEWCHIFPNGSRIYYGGLDSKERTDKILGQEHSTIFLNECSQISYAARNKAMTRLSQRAIITHPNWASKGGQLRLKMIYDCNPPSMAHWSYPLFIQGLEPTGRAPVVAADYATLQINPIHNLQNLDPQTIKNLESLPEKDKKRFLEGEYQANVVGALWSYDVIKRIPAPKNEAERQALLDTFKRVVVAVDPSGCSGDEDTRSDEIGILVCGLGYDGIGYVLEDLSGHYSPEGWGRVAVQAYDNWQADLIVAEQNYGGDMVRSTVQAHRKNVPFKKVTASRGKAVRAEPVSLLYHAGKIKHVGSFVDLETQMMSFSSAGYQGERSPDRADAMVWGFTELMLDPRRGESSTVIIKGMI